MENIISIEKYIEMGKVKVVPVETETPSDVAEPEVKEEPSEPEVKSEQLLQGVLQSRTEPDVKQESLAVEAPVVEESKPKKEPSMISCENCGKSMLMKTYKYSHMKVCKPLVPEPPPPPPPTPEPKAKAKPKLNAAPPKPKAAPPKPKAEKPVIAKPEFSGEVSFSNFEAPQLSHTDLYRQAREQRQQVRVQRVRSLISQAI